LRKGTYKKEKIGELEKVISLNTKLSRRRIVTDEKRK